MFTAMFERSDCGIYTIKYMEMWDPITTYEGGYSMPTWTEVSIILFIPLVVSIIM
jgi:nucleoside 2-deoxyribosyltransferase